MPPKFLNFQVLFYTFKKSVQYLIYFYKVELLPKLKFQPLSNWTKQRQSIASQYNQLLNGIGDIVLPIVVNGATHVYHLYVIRTKRRDALQEYLQHHGIGTLIHYPIPVHLQEAYKSLGHQNGSFPIAESIASTCLSLPIWPGMTTDDVEFVSGKIKQFF